MNPKISVIFPVGNREAFLAEALESILAQTFGDLEVIAVLDGVQDSGNVQAACAELSGERIELI